MKMMRLVLLCGFLLPLSISAGPASTQGWSRFRGPNGSGVLEAPRLPVELGREHNVLWVSEVPFARSSPVLTANRVFLSGSDDEHLILLCLDRATGELLWERRLARARQEKRYKGNDSASPSPLTDGENVYAFFPELGVVSYDGGGKQRWIHELGPFKSFYGMSSSPILAGGSVFLQCDQERDSFLLALDRNDGKIRWKAKRPGMAESYATPVLYPSAEKPLQLITYGSRQVTGYSPSTGEELWKEGGLGVDPVCSPVVESKTLIVCGSNPAETPIPPFSSLIGSLDKDKDTKLSEAELKQTFFGDHFGWLDRDDDGFVESMEWDGLVTAMSSADFGLVAMDLNETRSGGKVTKIWRFKKSLAAIATPLIYRKVLYMVRDGGILTSLDPATGEEYKRGRIPSSGGEYFPSPVAGDGKVYIANNSGKVIVVKAGPEWEVLKVNDLHESINATPLIGEEGALFVRTKSRLYCFRDVL